MPAPHRRALSARIQRDGLRTLGLPSAPYSPLDASGAVSGAGADPRAIALSALSERAFQQHVVDALRERGWVVWTVPNMRLTTAGLPDVLAYHPDRPGLLLAYELKRQQRSRTSDAQRRALAHLATVPGIDARIVRPADWDEIVEVLSRDA